MTSRADTLGVRCVDPGQRTEVAGLVAAAFHDLPQSVWLVPEPRDRPAVLAAVFELAVTHAVQHGWVPVVRDDDGLLVGAAVWVPSTAPDIDDHDTRLATAAGSSLPRWRAFELLQHAHHPLAAHHYLALLAVHPDRQRQGWGTRLLTWAADELGPPAYLEAATPELVRTYRRFGFQESPPFRLPAGPPTWPMWRVI